MSFRDGDEYWPPLPFGANIRQKFKGGSKFMLYCGILQDADMGQTPEADILHHRRAQNGNGEIVPLLHHIDGTGNDAGENYNTIHKLGSTKRGMLQNTVELKFSQTLPVLCLIRMIS